MIRLLLEPVNLLILDEPTNHLDMQSKDILKDALRDFGGTLIVVSHDRYFLDGLIDKVYEFGGGKVVEHLGGIYDFLQKKKIDNLQELERKQPQETKAKIATEPTTQSKQDYEAQKEKQRQIRKIEKQIAETEAAIAKLEAEQKAIEEKLALPENQTDSALFEQYERIKREAEQKMYEWEILSEQLIED